MAKLSIEKMKEIKKASGLTNKEISERTGLSESSITKLFGGFQVNPSIEAISKIAEVLSCEVDDFIERTSEPTSPYYLDKITAELAQNLKDNPDLKAVLRAARDIPPEDIQLVIDLINKMKK